MNTPDFLRLLPLLDWLALAWFFAAWLGYAWFARWRGMRPGDWQHGTLLAATNHYRRLWMLQTTARDNRVVDGVVMQSLTTSPSFFASTTILIIGGLLALLGTTDKASEIVREIPFAARTSALVFDLKLGVLTGVFVYAFFRFTWSMRQYSFGALMIASALDHKSYERNEAARNAFADRAGGVIALAAETFNDGLRAYYMAFAMVLWFFSPIAFAVSTALVILILYRREFHSDVLEVLRSDNNPT